MIPILQKSERNCSPSLLTLSDPNKGVISQMNNEIKKPNYNGKSLDALRDESSLNRLGKLEQVAQAEKLVEENMKVYKKSAFATEFARALQQHKANKSNNKR